MIDVSETREHLNETLQTVFGISLNEIIQENPEIVEEELQAAISMEMEISELAEHMYEVYQELTIVSEYNEREKEDYLFSGLFFCQR